MAQCLVKALAINAGDLSFISLGPTQWKVRTNSLDLSPDLHNQTLVHTHTGKVKTNKQNRPGRGGARL